MTNKSGPCGDGYVALLGKGPTELMALDPYVFPLMVFDLSESQQDDEPAAR